MSAHVLSLRVVAVGLYISTSSCAGKMGLSASRHEDEYRSALLAKDSADFRQALTLISKDRKLLRVPIKRSTGDRVLHLAARMGETTFIQELLRCEVAAEACSKGQPPAEDASRCLLGPSLRRCMQRHAHPPHASACHTISPCPTPLPPSLVHPPPGL